MWLPENSDPFHHKHKQCNPLSSLLYLDCFQSKESNTPNATPSFILKWDLQNLYIASGTFPCLPFQCLDCVLIMHVLLESINKCLLKWPSATHTKEEKAWQSYDLLWCLTVMTTALTQALKVLSRHGIPGTRDVGTSSRPAWATEWIQDQLGQLVETLSQNKNVERELGIWLNGKGFGYSIAKWKTESSVSLITGEAQPTSTHTGGTWPVRWDNILTVPFIFFTGGGIDYWGHLLTSNVNKARQD